MITPEQLAATDTEHGHQAALFLWAAMNRENDPRLSLLFAVPNGGERNKATAGRLKAEGVKAGVPDLFLPVPTKERRYMDNYAFIDAIVYAGLFIEMKKPSVRLKRKAPEHKWDTGGVSDNQKQWLDALTEQGYKCVVCYSWLEAANEIKLYLTGKG